MSGIPMRSVIQSTARLLTAVQEVVGVIMPMEYFRDLSIAVDSICDSELL